MVRISSFSPNNFIGKKLYKLYKTNTYTDLWLQSSDGKDFMAHRCVCAASSVVIGNVISSVGKVSPNASILIPLNAIDSETLTHVIDFIYLGELLITESLVEKLLKASKILEILTLEEACQEAIEQLRLHSEYEDDYDSEQEAADSFKNEPFSGSRDSDAEYIDTGESADTKPIILHGNIVGEEFEIHETDVVEEEEVIDESGHNIIHLDDGTTATVLVQGEFNPASVGPGQADLEDIETQLLGKSLAERKSVRGPFYCSDCGLKFLTTNALAKHRLMHITKTHRLQCTICGKILFSRKALEEHEARHRSPNCKDFPCTYCEKSFASKAALSRHEMTHTDDRAFQCQFCSKTFCDEAACEQHMDTHAGIKPHACSYCEFSCNSKLILYKHEAKHRGVGITTAKQAETVSDAEGNRIFTCQDCNRSFAHYSSYWMHLRVHADDRRFPCRYCGKSFFTKQQTQVHERIHTGAKPYACSICGKTFSQPGRVKLHERIHTGEKPYACRHCGKSFAVKGNCDAHERIHTGEKRYECPFCAERFALKSRMLQHQMVHTGPQILEMKEVEVDGSQVTEISISMT